jgi:hypothetical protein
MSAAGKRGGRFSYLTNAAEREESAPPSDAEGAAGEPDNSSLPERQEPRPSQETKQSGGEGQGRTRQRRSGRLL